MLNLPHPESIKPDHNIGLLVLALIVLALIGLAIWWIESRNAKKYDSYFNDSPISDETARQRDAFWAIVREADLRRQQHLEESETSNRNDHQPAA